MVTIRNYTGFETGDFSETRPSAGFGTRSVSATAARSGSYGFLVNPGDSTTGYEQFRYISSTTGKEGLGTAQTEAWRFDFRAVALPSSASRFLVVVTGNQIYFTLDNTGTIRAYYDPNSPTLLGTSPSGAITANTWHVVEIKATCGSGNSTDFIELRVDGVTQFTNSAASISFEGGTFDNGLLLGRNNTPGGAIEFHYDNVVTSDDWLPSLDVDIAAFEPTGDSASNVNWTASAGNKWACLDEFPPSATDYISSGTSAGDQLYSATHASMATKGVAGKAILGVKTTALMREATSTTTLGRIGIRAGSTNYETSDVDIGSTTVITMAKIYQSNPDTSADWTDAEVNAAEPLVVRSTSDTSNIRCVALYLMVLTIPLMAAAGASADIQFEGTASTFLAQFPAGAPASIQFEGTVSTYTAQQIIASSENAAINSTESDAIDVTDFIASVEDSALNVTEAESLTADPASAENAALNSTEDIAIEAQLDTAEDAAINSAESGDIGVLGGFDPRRLRVDVYDIDGTTKLGAGPLTSILGGARYSMRLDEIGTFTFSIPANDPNRDMLDYGRRVWLYREGEGLVFKGIITGKHIAVNSDKPMVVVSGLSLAGELLHSNVLLNRQYDLDSAATIVADLMDSTGWTAGTVDAGLTAVTAELNGLSRWAGLVEMAKLQRVHVRENNLTAEVDYGAFGDDSGLIWRNVEHVDPELQDNTDLSVIASIRQIGDAKDLYNVIVPLGAGEGSNRLDLRYSTRNTPYTIQTGTLPNGETYWYLSDATSVAAYGPRTKVVSFKKIAPLVNSTSGFQAASNMLYDAAVDFLTKSKDPVVTHDVSVIGRKHVDPLTGLPYFKLGQKVRVVYRGWSTDETGERDVWLDVDTDLWLMGMERTFDDKGIDSWRFDAVNVDALAINDSDKVAGMFADIKALQYYNKPYNFERVDGPQRQGVNASYPLEFVFDYDEAIAYLLKAKLRFRLKPLRVNATGAASGGGTTSGAGSTHTHSITPSLTGASGGGQTSSAGSSHSHSISGQSAASQGAFNVVYGWPGADIVSETPSTPSTQAQSTSHTHNETGSVTGLDNSNHTHSMNNHTHSIPSTGALSYVAPYDHTHSVSGTTSGSEATHTHTVSDHTHSITGTITAANESTHTHSVDAHVHSITYGIFESSAPVTPLVNITINGVNRTAALGGGSGWNTGQTLDITEYLIDTEQQPLRQTHTILLSAAELCDLEVVLRSTVTASSIAP